MELPQPRPFKTEGRKARHDFLSLCSHSSDPKPTTSSSQGSHLKTQDFLQPLECMNAKEEITRIDTTTTTTSSEKLPQQHVLPGGIGTYTISSIPYFNHQRIPKPELSPPMMFNASSQASGGNERNSVDEITNSNSTSYTAVASGFTTMGHWPLVERPSQSLANNHLSGFSSGSSSLGSGLKSQSFMDMLRSAKGSSQEDDLDDEEDFIMKKESSSTSQSQRVGLRVKPGNVQKLNTPRSKHSATEQRRRSKINDRFQMLRQLIPNSDQKRDKASFLLEVIEYIQFLQEKANKYETTPYEGWSHEPSKLLNWHSNNQQIVPEGIVTFATKLEEEKSDIVVIDQPESLNRATATVTQTQPSNEDDEEEDVHEGSISISSVYSQGLVKTLREALENSGIDLTKASISVQIELAKQSSLLSSFKDREPVSLTGNDDVKQTRKSKRLKMGL